MWARGGLSRVARRPARPGRRCRVAGWVSGVARLFRLSNVTHSSKPSCTPSADQSSASDNSAFAAARGPGAPSRARARGEQKRPAGAGATRGCLRRATTLRALAGARAEDFSGALVDNWHRYGSSSHKRFAHEGLTRQQQQQSGGAMAHGRRNGIFFFFSEVLLHARRSSRR